MLTFSIFFRTVVTSLPLVSKFQTKRNLEKPIIEKLPRIVCKIEYIILS